MTDWIEDNFVPGLLLAAGLSAVACAPVEQTPQPFSVGQYACIELTGERGMVTHVFPEGVYLRIGSAVTSSQQRLPQSYPEVYFKFFEIESCR